MASNLTFKGLLARQSNRHTVVTFAASASEILEIAEIDRIGRTDEGDLFGFQRPQIARHIHEIRDYLARDDAVLPNSVVLAFTQGVAIREINGSFIEIEVDRSQGAPGLVVDGQQRLSALAPLENKDFEIFVSAILCEDEEELRRQFILINNTRPLPKELIYELLPTVGGLPHRLSSRSFAAALTERLNFDASSSIKGEIRQHTNPGGTLSSNAIQKVIMNSRSNGAIRELVGKPDGMEASFALISAFFAAVKETFPEAWFGMSPKTSRLVHGAGIVALGYVMEVAFALSEARTTDAFKQSLLCLRGKTAWSSGSWPFADEARPWNKIQNTNADIRLLAEHLVRIVRDQSAAVDGSRVAKLVPASDAEARLAI